MLTVPLVERKRKEEEFGDDATIVRIDVLSSEMDLHVYEADPTRFSSAVTSPPM
jgi:hypothetical protein